MILVVYLVSQLEIVHDTHIYTRLIWYTRIIQNYKNNRIELLKIFQMFFFPFNKNIFEPI